MRKIDLRVFQGLSAADRLEVVRVMGALVAVQFRLKILPWAWNRRWVFSQEGEVAEPSAALVRRALRWTEFLRRASRYLPLNVGCLRQALVLRGRLTLYGKRPRLVYGVRRSPENRFLAHAWVELGSNRFDPGGDGTFHPLG